MAKHLTPIVVTQDLLNDLGTLAAPSMLAVALRATLAELADPSAWMLAGYRAQFKEGARAGDTVQAALEEVAGVAGAKTFNVAFGKSDPLGRVGHWQLVWAPPVEGRFLPYSISQAVADGRTDRELWRAQAAVAEGEPVADAQTLLWLAGQSARGYLKRLDQAFAAGNAVDDMLAARSYGGIAVEVQVAQWPRRGEPLYCALNYERPLDTERQPAKKMDFPGVLVAAADPTYLLGTLRFTVVRLNAQRLAIYPDGATERK